MSIADERILEFLRDNDSGTPTTMSREDSMHFSRSYIHQRLGKLEEYGLVQFLGNGVYVLSEKGNEYLDGDLDVSTLDPTE